MTPLREVAPMHSNYVCSPTRSRSRKTSALPKLNTSKFRLHKSLILKSKIGFRDRNQREGEAPAELNSLEYSAGASFSRSNKKFGTAELRILSLLP